jgi:DNA-binding MarR family transcriptional regulator
MDMQHPLNCLTFATQRAARNLARGLEAALRPVGLTAPQFTTLSLMSPAKPESIAALATRLGTERTTMTRNLLVMTRKGWVESRPRTDAAPGGYVLTAEGQAVLAKALPLWTSHQARMVRQLGEDFAQTLIYNARRL